MDELRKTIQDLQVQLSKLEEALGNPVATEEDLRIPWYSAWTLASKVTTSVVFLAANISEHLRVQVEG